MNTPLMEMGDIGPALELLLRTYAASIRGENTSRAMVDVARAALEAEINRYAEGLADMRVKQASEPKTGGITGSIRGGGYLPSAYASQAAACGQNEGCEQSRSIFGGPGERVLGAVGAVGGDVYVGGVLAQGGGR